MKNFFVLIFLPILLIGCQTFEPPEIQELTFEKTEYYNPNLDLPKPDSPPQPIFVKVLDNGLSTKDNTIPGTEVQNKTFIVVDNYEDADHILFSESDYSKVGAVVRLAVTYKEITKEQVVLINTYIDQINALKELSSIERKKTQSYAEMWYNSEEAFRSERRSHRIDNTVNKGMWLGTVGAFSVLLFAL